MICDFAQALTMRQNRNQITSDDRYWVNAHPDGEPRLAMYALCKGYSDQGDRQSRHELLWVLKLSDGTHSMSDINERCRIAAETLDIATQRLQE